MFRDAIELDQPPFCETPEALDSVDVMCSSNKFVVGMIDPEVLVESKIDQPVVTSPAIGMEYGFDSDFTSNHRLQSGFGSIRDDLGVDLVATFEQAEDDRLPARSTASFAPDATRSEVGFIHFDLSLKWRIAGTGLSHSVAYSEKDGVHGSYRNASHRSGLGRRQIQSKTAHQMAKTSLTDLRTSKIPVNSNHHRSLALSSESFAS